MRLRFKIAAAYEILANFLMTSLNMGDIPNFATRLF